MSARPLPPAGADGKDAVSIVIPVLDERANIRPLVSQIARAMHGLYPFEVIFVDDGSSDDTISVIRSMTGIVDFDLRCIRLPRRFGQSFALVTGIRAACCPWIVTMDGDLQNDPADIRHLLPTVLDAYGRDPDVVCIAGIRARRIDSLVRRLSSRLANAVRRVLLRDGMPDTGCGLKIFRRDAFLALPMFDHVHRFLPALFQFSGGRVLTANVNHRPRTAGKSKYGIGNRLWVGLADLAGVGWLRRRALLKPWQPVED